MSKLMQGQLQKYLTFMLVGYFAVSLYGSSGQVLQTTTRTAVCCETDCSPDDTSDALFTACILPPFFTTPCSLKCIPSAPLAENSISIDTEKLQNARAPPFFFG